MSILPMYRICPKCNRRYSFNPSVGKIFCPHCSASKNLDKKEDIKKIFSRGK